jgi:DNA-directed RNA polymerase subunit F
MSDELRNNGAVVLQKLYDMCADEAWEILLVLRQETKTTSPEQLEQMVEIGKKAGQALKLYDNIVEVCLLK